MILGLITPTSGSVKVLGAEMPRQRYQVLHRMNFESPYVDMPHRLTVRQNLTVFGRLYQVEGLAGPHRRAGRGSRSVGLPRPADRQAFVRAEDPRGARQGADQFAGGAAARRADRLARPRHRRLGAQPARALSRAAQCHRAACLAQHGGGRAPVRARHHHEARPHRRRRHAAAAARPLRPRDAGGGVPRRGARPRRPPARPRNERIHQPDRARSAPRRRHGAALSLSAALVLDAAS